jgi:cell division protein ZapA
LRRQVKVEILGQQYTIYTQAERAHVEQVAQHVASRCQEAQDTLRSSSVATIAVLAALNIASDYVQLKEVYEQLLARIERNQEKLASLKL